MTFGLYEAHPIDLLREELQALLAMLRGGAVDWRRAKAPFSVLLPDFVQNQPGLTPAHERWIEDLAIILLEHPPLEIDLVVGRASQTGSESNNETLSAARASAVADELTRLGVYPPPPTVGVGSSQPIQNLPGVESELNRSVEIRMWYDLSHHAPNVDESTSTNDHPADFWRSYMPGTDYDRAAMVVGLVYDNIDTLFLPIHESTVGAMNAITIWQDDQLVRSRALLGHYKQTGSDAQAILADIAAFNALLRDNGLSPHDFTGEEISDAEHFVTGAVTTMVPALGLALGPGFSFYWEYWQGLYLGVRTSSTDGLKYNMQQFIGADMAGVAYGMRRTYHLPIP